MRKKVIFDCDNTMGINTCDVDDGLALLYLLGEASVELCGITTTYGNSDIETVYSNTLTVLKEIGRTDIEVFKGCPNRYSLESDAVNYIVDTVNANPKDISILATGSLTNLFAAYVKDNELFSKISEIVIMGGSTNELRINGKVLDELNFSFDPSAAEWILKEGKNISILTGNNCLDAFFSETEFVRRLKSSNNSAAQYISEKCMYWIDDAKSAFNVKGFYNWDVVAAAYLARPELFKNDYKFISPNRKDLELGKLCYTPEEGVTCLVNAPIMCNLNELTEEIYSSWLRLRI